MKIDKYIPYITTVASLVTLISFLLSIAFPDKLTQSILIAVIFGLSAVIVLTFGYLSSKPSTLTISLLGPPNTGKSVYLTVLFNELISNEKYFNKISFQQYGIETVEEINNNYKDLLSGKWIPRTSYNDVFYYRASAIIKRPFFPKRYKLEVGDYAGEHLSQINESSSSWYHKSSFFKDVVSSDIIFLAIDISLLIDSFQNEKTIDKRVDAELAFVAAIQILIQEKGLKPNEKSSTPIVLLLTKADKLNNFEAYIDKSEEILEEYIQKIPRLNSLLKARFRYYRCYLTTSVGSTENDGPPKRLRPYNVVEPLIWSLQKM